MKWVYPKGKPTDKIDLEAEHRKQQMFMEEQYIAAVTRTPAQILIHTLLVILVICLCVAGIQHSVRKINSIYKDMQEIRATIVDSSDESRIDMVFRWSEVEYDAGAGTKREIIKYTPLSTQVGDTVLVYYDTETDRVYVKFPYVLFIVVLIIVIMIAILKEYGIFYDVYVVNKQKKRKNSR